MMSRREMDSARGESSVTVGRDGDGNQVLVVSTPRKRGRTWKALAYLGAVLAAPLPEVAYVAAAHAERLGPTVMTVLTHPSAGVVGCAAGVLLLTCAGVRLTSYAPKETLLWASDNHQVSRLLTSYTGVSQDARSLSEDDRMIAIKASEMLLHAAGIALVSQPDHAEPYINALEGLSRKAHEAITGRGTSRGVALVSPSPSLLSLEYDAALHLTQVAIEKMRPA